MNPSIVKSRVCAWARVLGADKKIKAFFPKLHRKQKKTRRKKKGRLYFIDREVSPPPHTHHGCTFLFWFVIVVCSSLPLHCVFPCPLGRDAVVLRSIGLVGVGNLRHERVIGVGVSKKRADGQQHLGDRERRRPVVLENV